ncbi:HIV Tat-specific factor 1 [Merluccius polli]|uniref:17S U2 SnRNP complex component HTATSF1 n=1 Tax=Merluccius polli TaxID=89951 RepID=A0AA47P4C7_MERPO|nr:HIV Tat-specific factor 1 [Merluccius polli]
MGGRGGGGQVGYGLGPPEGQNRPWLWSLQASCIDHYCEVRTWSCVWLTSGCFGARGGRDVRLIQLFSGRRVRIHRDVLFPVPGQKIMYGRLNVRPKLLRAEVRGDEVVHPLPQVLVGGLQHDTNHSVHNMPPPSSHGDIITSHITRCMCNVGPQRTDSTTKRDELVYLGVHVRQAVPAELVEETPVLQVLHDEGDELRMSDGPDRNQEFVEQLRMQQLYGQRRADGSDPYTYTDPQDGTVYDWDHDKKAWFPKITEDFMAAYQANYGFTVDGTPDANACIVDATKPAAPSTADLGPRGAADPEPALTQAPGQDQKPAKEAKQKGEKRKPEPAWFDVDDNKNTNVYVSGLPPDVSSEEFVELMSKCGIVMRDPITEEYKVKLYKDGQGNLKGDGLCCYLKKESVALAVRLIDESEVRGYKLHVEEAHFELKGQYDATKKKKKNKEYKKRLQQQQKQLDWRPEKKGEVRKRHEKVVIIQNMFHPSDFEEDPLVLNEYRDDLRIECEKFGQVKKVIIFDVGHLAVRHPDGVASVAFKEPDHADLCIEALNRRWFGGRQLSAVEETAREREERLKGWSNFLDPGSKKEKQDPNSSGPEPGATPDTPGPAHDASDPAPDTPGSAPDTSDPAPHTPGSTPDMPDPSSDLTRTTSEPSLETETRSQDQQEEEVDSTDSSLPGSDEEEA